MTSPGYPLHFHRRLKGGAATGATGDKERRSPAEGTDVCTSCGHAVIAPSTSTHLPTGQVVNHWQCSVCGHAWDTFSASLVKSGPTSSMG